MKARYQQILEGGVYDHVERCRIRRGEAGWPDYQAWITLGNTPLPPDRASLEPLDEGKAQRIADINAHAAALRNRFVMGRSVGEMVSWTIKLLDALAVTAGQPPPFGALMPDLQTALHLPEQPRSVNHALGLVRGLSEAEHAAKVLAQALPALAAEIALDGIRGRRCDEVAALGDPRDLATYRWLDGWPSL